MMGNLQSTICAALYRHSGSRRIAMTHRAVIFAKAIIVEEDLETFYKTVAVAMQVIEEAVQAYGWGEMLVAEGNQLPEFSDPPPE